jgi:hypothetical protein
MRYNSEILQHQSMSMNPNYYKKTDSINIPLLLILISLFSIFFSILATRDNIPNNDGILYMKTAQIFLSQGFESAKASFNWPFYPIMIAFLSKFTGLSILTAAYTLNTLLQLAIILGFIALFIQLKPTRSQLYFACFTILFFPQLNSYRSEIIRDFGYYAFSLWGLYNLLNYAKGLSNNATVLSNTKKIFCTIAYYICFMCAFLFRAEAVILMFTLPLSILLLRNPLKYKLKNLCFFYSPLLFIFLICILIYSNFYFLSGSSTKLIMLHHTIANIFSYTIKLNIFHLLNETYNQRISVVNTAIFNITHNDKLSTLAFLWFGLLPIAIIKYIKTLNVINIFFLGVFIKKYKAFKLYIDKPSLSILAFAIIINLAIPTGFLYLIFVITGRYYLLSALLLLLFVPFSMDYIYQRLASSFKSSTLKTIPTIAFILCLMCLIINSLIYYHADSSKQYLKQAGLWHKQHAFSSKRVLANNQQLAYYASTANLTEIDYDNLDLNSINKKQFDYVLLRTKYNDNNRLNTLHHLVYLKKIDIIKTFSNKKNDTVYICKLN